MPVIRTLAGMLRYGGFTPSGLLLNAATRRIAVGRVLQNALFSGLKLPSGRQAIGIFRRYGLGISTADFNRSYSRAKQMHDTISQGKMSGISGVVPKNLIGQLSRDWGEKYTYLFKRQYTDERTGNVYTEYKSTTSSQLWRGDTAESHMREVLSKYQKYSDAELSEYKLVYVAKRQDKR